MQVKCLLSGEMKLVPDADIFIAGFPCQLKSKLNKNSKDNKHCIKEKTGTTGEGFESIRMFIEKNRPRLVILENVPEVANHGEGKYMADAFTNAGYIICHLNVDATDYGSVVARKRWSPGPPTTNNPMLSDSVHTPCPTAMSPRPCLSVSNPHVSESLLGSTF